MAENLLARAVEQFADLTQGIPDAALERPWTWRDYDEGVRFAFFRTYEELRELAAISAAERANLGPPLTLAQRIWGQYHGAYRDAQAVLLGIGDEEADIVPADGEWPLRTVVEHIIATEIGFSGVIQYALDRRRGGDRLPTDPPQEVWDSMVGEERGKLRSVIQGPFADVMDYYARRHEKVLRAFADISDEELATPSVFWEDEAMTIHFRLHRFDSHLRQHTVQLEKTLEGIDRRPNEARRLLRLIYAALAEVEAATIGAWDQGADRRRSAADRIAARTTEIADVLAR